MFVASLGLCKELYEVSGWLIEDDTSQKWFYDGDRFEEMPPLLIAKQFDPDIDNPEFCWPAYALGYLLRKLPLEHTYRKYTGSLRIEYVDLDEKLWEAGYDTDDTNAYADTPEDAACKLAIELFKQNILRREG
jgi:hypothetical protein